ncbi:MAG: hypothetical protein COA42_17405 [Alteromonadaceae bacterium]|nr:MAG: hypothetical protein COA42_17405 [Alteromonadaceae bacterium]
MKNIYCTIITTVLLFALEVRAQDFQYLEYKGSNLISTHGMTFSLDIPPGFKKLSPINYQAVFNEHPFNVTIAVLIDEHKFIMVSAEELADRAGFLDYSYHKPVTLSGLKFFLRESCHADLSLEKINSSKDVAYVQKNGFDLTKPTILYSFFTSSEDGNSEYIVHYAKHVSSCGDGTISDDFKLDFMTEIEKNITVKRM